MWSLLVITLGIWLSNGQVGIITRPLNTFQDCTDVKVREILRELTLPEGATIVAVGYGCGEIMGTEGPEHDGAPQPAPSAFRQRKA